MAIEITDAAVARVKELVSTGKIPEQSVVRVGAKGGGCAGYEYSVAFVAGPGEGDVEMSSQGVAIYVQADAVDLLQGLQLDWVDGLHGAGLKFVNPGATATCGCGTSFSVS